MDILLNIDILDDFLPLEILLSFSFLSPCCKYKREDPKILLSRLWTNDNLSHILVKETSTGNFPISFNIS